jgi:sec-independent protein translocase protein TatA
MFASGLERPSVWAIIAIAALVLFGYKKLPEMSRAVGRSLRIFKTEMKGMTDDDAVREANNAPNAAPVTTPAAVQPPPAAPQPEPTAAEHVTADAADRPKPPQAMGA